MDNEKKSSRKREGSSSGDGEHGSLSMEGNRGKGEEKVFTLEQKVERLMKKEFKNHREVIKEIVAIEYEAMGIDPDSVFGNEKEMAEFIRRKKSRLREIEISRETQNKNDGDLDGGSQKKSPTKSTRIQNEKNDNPDEEQQPTSHSH